MPSKAMKPCSFPGCKNITRNKYCEAHRNKREEKKTTMYNSAWRKRSKQFLLLHPFCECKACKNSSRPMIAEVVDHKIPHKGNIELFWDETNWQSMSKKHHNKKTRESDMGSW